MRRVVVRDLTNLARHGVRGPRFAERIWVDPLAVERTVYDLRQDRSGEVSAGWEHRAVDLAERRKIVACWAHWGEGVPWADTGLFELLLDVIREEGVVDGLRSREDVVARYQQLDVIFARIADEGRLRTRRQISGWRSFRELGGIRVHVGPGDEPIFGGTGQHRLAIAQVLHLPRIPAQVGVVHPDALPTWRTTFGPPSSAASPDVPRPPSHPRPHTLGGAESA